MLRFASKPTGDMHIADLRVALFNYILCVQTKDSLVIRIEDTDTDKNIEGKDKEIIGLLDLFGVKYQNVVYQSDNVKYHRSMALSLLHEKIAFNCFCRPAVLEAKEKKAKNDSQPYKYDDACLSLSPEETIDNETPFTVRLRKPNVDVEFTDLIKGKMSYSPTDIDSFLILSAKKKPTEDFACAIDDMLADISMVIRSEEYLENTPKQIVTRAALNYTKEIKYAHIPLILNASGEKMNKEDEGNEVKWLLEEGFLPASIINYLISLGNNTPQEIFTLDEALLWFDLSSLTSSPSTFDMKALGEINKKHLNALDDIELSRYVGFADGDIGKLAKLYLQEVSTTKALKVKIGGIFNDKNIPSEFEDLASVLKPVIKEAPFFNKYDDFKSYLLKETPIDENALTVPLQLLLTGQKKGPKIEDMYPFIKNYLPEIVK